ncbi:MAG: cyclic nucleotide-binding domain-containing protein [Desulfobacula sp.]|uniref:Crp/Fnr family transcriptional regulator n=1 Tax=Desulfobacula sp. TaxID=2593537 RepID=UPI0025C7300E|nr:cyclic nucleotide-binding domain-containing protein [Desulfobacula sp.]MCD4719454.1 cyclic nucleotide-binding domain-containing protein [Desulfobacula sp.]
MVALEFIEELHIFKDFAADELNKLLDFCSVEDYQIGESLFLEEDLAKDMWIIMTGIVELRFEMPNTKPTTNESTLSSHHNDIPESQVFGWSCFIPPYQMRLSAYCTSRRCQALKIDATRLNNLMMQDTAIGYKIMRYLVQVVGYRFKQMQEEVGKFIGINMMNSW